MAQEKIRGEAGRLRVAGNPAAGGRAPVRPLPALIEAAVHAARHPVYAQRYRRTKTRLGRQRGPKVAQVDLARRLAEAIWHMLSTNQPFAPAGAA